MSIAGTWNKVVSTRRLHRGGWKETGEVEYRKWYKRSGQCSPPLASFPSLMPSTSGCYRIIWSFMFWEWEGGKGQFVTGPVRTLAGYHLCTVVMQKSWWKSCSGQSYWRFEYLLFTAEGYVLSWEPSLYLHYPGLPRSILIQQRYY